MFWMFFVGNTLVVGMMTAIILAVVGLVYFVRWIGQVNGMCYAFDGPHTWDKGRVEFYQAMPRNERRLWRKYKRMRAELKVEVWRRITDVREGKRPRPAAAGPNVPLNIFFSNELYDEMGMGSWEWLRAKYADKAPECEKPEWWW
jgi:hypothetical protein